MSLHQHEMRRPSLIGIAISSRSIIVISGSTPAGDGQVLRSRD